MFILQFLLCLSLAHAESQHHIPLSPDDLGVDIPKVGSSVFDKIFSEPTSSGARYVVPFPFQAFLARLQESSPVVVHSLFPFSRSLQRPVDMSYDPLLNPRLVIGADRGSLTRNKFFVGYVKATDQLEVISYNDEAGRFEYQLVRNYSHEPRVFYVNRGKCLTCHQGQSPILSAAPWLDSTFGQIGDLVGARLGLKGEERADSALHAERLFGTPLGRQRLPVLDSLVREANDVTLDERIWLIGCGSSRECRLGLLLRTLAPMSRHYDKYYDVSVEVLKKSSLHDQRVYHSFLSSMDLGARSVVVKYSRDSENLDFAAVALNPGAIREIIDNIHRLEPSDNPASRRPQTLTDRDLADLRLTTFSVDDMIVLNEEIKKPGELGEILFELYQSGSPIFDPGSINKLEIMKVLLSRAGSARADEFERWLVKPTPVKQLLAEPLTPVFVQPQLNIFSRHCHSCHASGLLFPPQFLIGQEDEVIGKIRQMKDRIRFKLVNQMMPPSPEARRLLNDSGDREILLQYLESL